MPSATKWRGLRSQLFLLVMIAAVLGGGGVAYGLANLVVQLIALVFLAFNRTAFFNFWSHANTPLRWLVALTLALPALHLIPLPPSAWSALPGRELAYEARASLGPLQWHPLSLDSGRTLVSLLGLIAPLTVLVIGLSTSSRALLFAAWGLAAMGLINFAIGIPQVLSPSEQWFLYPENPMSGVLFGAFANRNSAGVFLVICLLLVLHLPGLGPVTRNTWIRATAAILLLVAVVLTQSRSAMALTILPLASAGVRWGSANWPFLARSPKRVSFAMAAVGALLVSAFVLAFGAGSRIDTGLDRFSIGNEARENIWSDARFSAQKYWPIGAGMGTFDEVFQADESLENLTAKTAGRAHNDYLEVAIEAGIGGLALIVGWAGLIGWLAWRARHLSDPWLAWVGGLIWLTIGLQSFFDYPLRSQTMLIVAAFALVMLVRGQSANDRKVL